MCKSFSTAVRVIFQRLGRMTGTPRYEWVGSGDANVVSFEDIAPFVAFLGSTADAFVGAAATGRGRPRVTAEIGFVPSVFGLGLCRIVQLVHGAAQTSPGATARPVPKPAPGFDRREPERQRSACRQLPAAGGSDQ